jgi:hypothetical protein
MRTHVRSRTARLVAALVVAGALFGIATAVDAAIPDSAGTIHGCYAKTSQGAAPAGSLRVVDSGIGQVCNANEVGLNWSQTGPKGSTGAKGPTGAAGPNGATGAQGPAGAEPAFANYASGDITMQSGDTRTVADVLLPVGTYTLSGEVQVEIDGDTQLSCSLQSSGVVHQRSGWTVAIDPFAEFISPILGDATVATPNTSVRVICTAQGSDPLIVRGASLIATQVSSVTVEQ